MGRMTHFLARKQNQEDPILSSLKVVPKEPTASMSCLLRMVLLLSASGRTVNLPACLSQVAGIPGGPWLGIGPQHLGLCLLGTEPEVLAAQKAGRSRGDRGPVQSCRVLTQREHDIESASIHEFFIMSLQICLPGTNRPWVKTIRKPLLLSLCPKQQS